MGDRSRVDAAYTGKINHVIRELEFWACDQLTPGEGPSSIMWTTAQPIMPL